MGKTGKKGGKRLKKKELAKMLMELFQNNPAEVYETGHSSCQVALYGLVGRFGDG